MNLRAENHYDEFSTCLPLADLKWKYTDHKGHEHQYAGDDYAWKLPTLNWVVDVPSDDEYPAEGHYECKECGEKIEPKTVFNPGKLFHVLIGRSFYADGREVTEEEFGRLWKEQQSLLAR